MFNRATISPLDRAYSQVKFWNGVPGALPALSTFAPRQLLISAALGIWATRLGTFLLRVFISKISIACSLSYLLYRGL